jgi:ribosomal protein S12 methylthiotransferase accessory factor
MSSAHSQCYLYTGIVEISSQTRLDNLPFPQGMCVSARDEIIASGDHADFEHETFRKAFASSLFDAILTSLESLTGRLFFVRNYNKEYVPSWRKLIRDLIARRYATVAFTGRLYNDLPRIYQVFLQGGLDGVRTDGYTTELAGYGGAGSSTTYIDALRKATGELLERATLAEYREADLLRVSPRTLSAAGLDFLDPERLFMLTRTQSHSLGLTPPSDGDEYLWVEGREVLTGKCLFLPAQAVFWNYRLHHGSWSEKYFTPSTSNGAACHVSLNRALISGIYELVERDGFLLHWLSGVSPGRLDPSTFSASAGELHSLLKQCRDYLLSVHFLILTTNLEIPTVGVVLEDATMKSLRVLVSCAAGPTFESAALKALTECIGVFNSFRKKLDEGMPFEYLPHPRARTHHFNINARVMLWANPAMFEKFSFFISGGLQDVNIYREMELRHREESNDSSLLTKRFACAGEDYRVYFFKGQSGITSGTRACVVKVIIPALLPMYFDENIAPLGSSRLMEFAREHGSAGEKLEPYPHPFP